MKSLWTDWPRVRTRLTGAKKRLFLFDFDGTLVSIAKTPDAVRLRAGTRRCLEAVARKPGNSVAIISGRSLKDLRSFIGIRGICYVGNHGLEMCGKGLLPAPPQVNRARKIRFTMRALTEKLRSDLYYLPGILVEDKGFTVSVHYRNLPAQHMPAFLELIRFFRERYRAQPVRWRQGKKVWEVIPKVRWHKGFAALYLLKRSRGAVPVAVGDDLTDEDMFRALRRTGITVRVGRLKGSSAKYYVKSRQEVDALLEEFTR